MGVGVPGVKHFWESFLPRVFLTLQAPLGWVPWIPLTSYTTQGRTVVAEDFNTLAKVWEMTQSVVSSWYDRWTLPCSLIKMWESKLKIHFNLTLERSACVHVWQTENVYNDRDRHYMSFTIFHFPVTIAAATLNSTKYIQGRSLSGPMESAQAMWLYTADVGWCFRWSKGYSQKQIRAGSSCQRYSYNNRKPFLKKQP